MVDRSPPDVIPAGVSVRAAGVGRAVARRVRQRHASSLVGFGRRPHVLPGRGTSSSIQTCTPDMSTGPERTRRSHGQSRARTWLALPCHRGKRRRRLVRPVQRCRVAQSACTPIQSVDAARDDEARDREHRRVIGGGSAGIAGVRYVDTRGPLCAGPGCRRAGQLGRRDTASCVDGARGACWRRALSTGVGQRRDGGVRFVAPRESGGRERGVTWTGAHGPAGSAATGSCWLRYSSRPTPIDSECRKGLAGRLRT
jgi:hypothetical protein